MNTIYIEQKNGTLIVNTNCTQSREGQSLGKTNHAFKPSSLIANMSGESKPDG